MKKFLALLLTLVLIFSFTTALADFDELPNHKMLDIFSSTDDYFNDIENDSVTRVLFVYLAMCDCLESGILDLNEIRGDYICAGSLLDFLYYVFIPLKNDQMLTVMVTTTGSCNYLITDDTPITSKTAMITCLNGLKNNNSLDDYWFVPADDIVTMATAAADVTGN